MQDKNEVTRTRKKISLFSATALSATCMVGSGWLFSAQLNAKLAGNYSFLAWLLAAILVVMVGLCLAQVVAVFPVRGATSRSSALSHNKVFGMPFAFSNWFGMMVTISTEAQATTQYLSGTLKNDLLMSGGALTVEGKGLAILILLLYLFINYYGIRLLSRVNNVVTLFKIITPFFMIAVLLSAHFDHTNFDLPTNSVYGIQSAFDAILGGGLIYSFNGFQMVTAFASEIEKPGRNVPLAMVFSILLVLVVYLLLQLSFMGGVPHALIEQGWASLNFKSPLVEISLLLGMHFSAALLLVDSVVSPSGTGYSHLGGSARLFYGMAVEGQMPRWAITKLHEKFNLCRRSMMINWLLAVAFLLNSSSWSSLMILVTGYQIIGYMAAPISMGGIKPKTRIAGVIVFTLIGLLMRTINSHDFLAINCSILGLMLIYGLVQMKSGTNLVALLTLAMPFVVYLWILYFSTGAYITAAVSAVFYLLITSNRYVAYCKTHKGESVKDIENEI